MPQNNTLQVPAGAWTQTNGIFGFAIAFAIWRWL